eukprot:Opistho-2@77251
MRPDVSHLSERVCAFYESDDVSSLEVTVQDEYLGSRRTLNVVYRASTGQGPLDSTLLCIHGFPTCMFDWHLIWDRLLSLFGRVIAVDLLGFGLSDKPSRFGYTFKSQADVCESVLETLGVTNVHFLAHDYGVTVAQELLARKGIMGRTLSLSLPSDRPETQDQSFADATPIKLNIQSVVFLNGGLFPESHQPRLIQKLLLVPILGRVLASLTTRGTFARSFRAVFGPNTQPTDAEMDEYWGLVNINGGSYAVPDTIVYMTERRMYRERYVGALMESKVPMRLVNGPADPVSGAHLAARYREQVPNADVIMLGDDIGHYPQVEDPDGVWSAFAEFHTQQRAKSTVPIGQ